MGSNREEKIDAWIFEQGIKEDRRRRIIPSSTDRITHQPVGTGLEAMENVARYFGDPVSYTHLTLPTTPYV